jgi:hypothetical protein
MGKIYNKNEATWQDGAICSGLSQYSIPRWDRMPFWQTRIYPRLVSVLFNPNFW